MKTTIFVHSSKEQCWETGESLGLTGDALMMFRHAGEDFRIDGEVDPKTGAFTPTHLDGKEIKK